MCLWASILAFKTCRYECCGSLYSVLVIDQPSEEHFYILAQHQTLCRRVLIGQYVLTGLREVPGSVEDVVILQHHVSNINIEITESEWSHGVSFLVQR